MLLFGFAILYKLVHIQHFSTKNWKAAAENMDVRLKTVKANRGNIYTDNGSLMATSLPYYYVAFDPSVSKRGESLRKTFEEGIDSLSMLLSGHFKDRTAAGYEQKIRLARSSDRQYLRLSSKRVNYHQKKIMEKWPIFREGQMKGGVIFEKVDDRENPFDQLAFISVGYLKDGKGKKGLESSFDSLLQGKDGKALFAKIGGGKWKPIRDKQERKPEDGYDIVTTIDINMQDVVETALHNALAEHEADNGCAIVMEVSTGEIKAIANLDKITKTNERTGEKSYTFKELYNHAVAKKMEPGSTFKLASLMAVLEERGSELSLKDSVDCTKSGRYRFFDKTMYDAHPVDKVTVKEAFAKSSNIGVAKLSMETFYTSKETQENFSDYFTAFGLRDDLRFQIHGAAVSNIKSPKDDNWSGTSIPWISHGYELELSPLQLLTFYNTVANDGKMIQPILVKEVRKADEVLESYQAKVLRESICSKRTIQYAQEMLESVVNEGTARRIKTEEYQIAGKTGTAKQLVDGKYSRMYYASFAGYFPADNPKYSCIIVVDNPQKGRYYGSDVAAPVFREIADNIYRSDLEIHPVVAEDFKREEGHFPVVKAGYQADLNQICQAFGLNLWQVDSQNSQWVEAKRNDEFKAIEWRKRTIHKDKVPNVKGMTLRDALPILENLGLRVAFVGNGRVTSQSKLPGEELIVGSNIKLELEN